MILGIHNWLEIISALVCTIALIYKPLVYNRWFVLFLWTTVVIELIGKLTIKYPKVKMPMYNIFNGVEFIFYLTFLLFALANPKIKKWILGQVVIFFLFFIINIVLIQGIYLYNNYTTILGSILVILTSLILLFDISFSNPDHYKFIKWPLLCLIFGLFLFYSGNLINTGLLNYMFKQDPDNATRLYKLINNNLNIVLYGLFSIGFVAEQFHARKKLTNIPAK